MNGKTVVAALALAAMGLSACNGSNGQRANSKICTPFPKVAASTSTPAPATPGVIADAASPVDDCLHRWAYSLAPSTDPADAVAEATVAACSSALSRWNQQAIAQPAGAPGEVQALSLTTGQPTNAVSEHYAFAQSRAMFYVVQARAGRCAPPPPPAAAS